MPGSGRTSAGRPGSRGPGAAATWPWSRPWQRAGLSSATGGDRLREKVLWCLAVSEVAGAKDLVGNGDSPAGSWQHRRVAAQARVCYGEQGGAGLGPGAFSPSLQDVVGHMMQAMMAQARA